MTKWSLRPDPGPHDPDRHVLLVKGEMKSISQIVKKFGAMCGRPSKIENLEGFNFSIHLHAITKAGVDKVIRYLEEIAPSAKGDLAAAAPPVREESAGAPPPFSPLQAGSGASAPPAEPISSPAAAFPGLTVAPAVKALWGLQSPPDPKLTFDSLLVGAYNRFAHAAATSVIGAPGTMYNPLFIYGAPGVGKTHMLNAIAAAYKKNWGENAVIVTTGAALANAVSCALAEGRLSEIDNLVAGAKALLVDDVHLLAITERNQAPLAKIFGESFARNSQVVLTSVYAPRALGALEDALKISLTKGWAVDMKTANPTVQEEMISAFVARTGISLESADIKRLCERLGGNHSEFSRLVLRWGALSELYRAKGTTPSADDMLGDLFNAGAKGSPAELPAPTELEASRRFAPPAPAADAINLALFCPRGQDAMVAWLVARFYKVGADFGITQTFRHVLCESYDTENPLGVPFQIGESCRRSDAQAALVLGPPREARLAAQEGEFVHAIRHILESFGLAAGWIPFAETTVTRSFLAAHLDFKIFFKR